MDDGNKFLDILFALFVVQSYHEWNGLSSTIYGQLCGFNNSGVLLSLESDTCACAPETQRCCDGARTEGCGFSTQVDALGDLSVRRSVFNATSCPHCGCCLSNASIYHVAQPALWTVWQMETPATIEWASTEVPGSTVDVALLLTHANGSVSRVATLAHQAPNTGLLVWNVTTGTGPGSAYRVLVALSETTEGGATGSSAVSDLFTIVQSIPGGGGCPEATTPAAVPSAPATCPAAHVVPCQTLPAPVAEQLGYDCGFCARTAVAAGQRQRALHSAVATVATAPHGLCTQCCSACPAGFVTPARGGDSAVGCTVRRGSPLEQFEELRHVGLRLAASWVYDVLPSPTTAENCARACALDERCRAFDLRPCRSAVTVSNVTSATSLGGEVGMGMCNLAEESFLSPLYRPLSVQENTSHFYKTNTTAASGSRLATHFEHFPAAFFALTPTSVLGAAPASVAACAAWCLREPTCLSFFAGIGPRLGTCVIANRSHTSANTTLIVADTPTSGGLARVAVAAQWENLDYYFRVPAQPCAAGEFSPTGAEPGCTPCPLGSYGAAGNATRCVACPAGSTTRNTSSTAATACIPRTCPAGADGPDAANDCGCEIGSTCVGDDMCLVDATSGRHYFSIWCDTCRCTARIDPPTINHVFEPYTGSTQYWGETSTIRYEASNGVAYVNVYLFKLHPTLTYHVQYVDTIGTFVRNTGTLSWVVGRYAERDDYVVVVFHARTSASQPLAPTHRNTGAFSIRNPSTACPPGKYNAATGTGPCAFCPIGTYWHNASACTPCPGTTTTLEHGSLSPADCTINDTHALHRFTQYAHRYIRASAAAGYHLEEIDHQTPEACAQLCLDDAGCKSLTAGVVDQHQAGDCFLNYDDRDTAFPGYFLPVSQLNYFERNPRPMQHVSTSMYTQTRNCHLQASDDGGINENAYTVETCAQLCLNDVCCKSFDAGQTGTDAMGHCFLSYEAPVDNPAALTCGDEFHLDLFVQELFVDASFGSAGAEAVLRDSGTRQAFAAAVAAVVDDGALYPPSVTVTAVSTPPRLVARFHVADKAQQGRIADAVDAGQVALTFPDGIGRHYTAAFTDTEGFCALGTVSQTGHKPNCTTCRADTFSNRARTVCLQCPKDMVSDPGSYLVQHCHVADLDQGGLFNLHDEYVGSFSVPGRGGGGLTLRVTRTNRSTGFVEMIATFRHGGFCNITLGCRTQGVSEFYLQGVISNFTHLDMQYVTGFIGGANGWVGITDRGFQRENLSGAVTAVGNATQFAGAWGALGVFSTVRRCTARTADVGVLQTGDVWQGYYVCDAAAGAHDEEDVYAVSLAIAAISSHGDVSAIVTVTTDNGTYEYSVAGVYAADSRCGGLQLTPVGAADTVSPAWRTTHPPWMVARQWSGHLLEDGEHFEGQLNVNPHCACTGAAPYDDAMAVSTADFCDRIGDDRCWTSSACPEAIQSTQYPGFYHTDIGPFQTCNGFKLAKVCSRLPTLCPPGWSEFNFRCYKYYGTARAANYTAARQTCQQAGGFLASIHNNDETAFVQHLVAEPTANSTQNTTTTPLVWIGLQSNASTGVYTWLDGSVFVFANWADGYPQPVATAVALNPRTGEWATTAAAGPRAFVCKAPLLVIESDCSCLGVSDADGHGARCLFWNASAPAADARPWCYTSQHCPHAAHVDPAASLWRSACTPSEALLTYRDDPRGDGLGCAPQQRFFDATSGACVPCTTAADCADNETLTGTCANTTDAVCAPCDAACAGCTDVRATDCVACADGYQRSGGASGACVATSTTSTTATTTSSSTTLVACPAAHFRFANTCRPCDASCGTCVGPSADDCITCPAASRFRAGLCVPADTDAAAAGAAASSDSVSSALTLGIAILILLLLCVFIAMFLVKKHKHKRAQIGAMVVPMGAIQHDPGARRDDPAAANATAETAIDALFQQMQDDNGAMMVPTGAAPADPLYLDVAPSPVVPLYADVPVDGLYDTLPGAVDAEGASGVFSRQASTRTVVAAGTDGYDSDDEGGITRRPLSAFGAKSKEEQARAQQSYAVSPPSYDAVCSPPDASHTGTLLEQQVYEAEARLLQLRAAMERHTQAAQTAAPPGYVEDEGAVESMQHIADTQRLKCHTCPTASECARLERRIAAMQAPDASEGGSPDRVPLPPLTLPPTRGRRMRVRGPPSAGAEAPDLHQAWSAPAAEGSDVADAQGP
eukprot:m.1502694 g.1502694  ORF g.1502694 m.1502694 type:complete len:2193 (+) comp25207_c0_seq49:437-7015(+)